MNYIIAFIKGANLRIAKIWFVAACALLAFLFFGLEVKAQLQPPCVDSTPLCPCILSNGDCMDIDTPIDNEVIILLLAGLSYAIYKLNFGKVETNI